MLARPRLLAAAGAVLAALACAAPASARIIEIGATAAQAAPTCPSSPCRAVTRTTGYQAKVVDSRAEYVVPRNGRIVAWTISLGESTEKVAGIYGISREAQDEFAVLSHQRAAAAWDEGFYS